MTRRDDPHVAARDGSGERGAGNLRHLPAVVRVAGQWLVDGTRTGAPVWVTGWSQASCSVSPRR